MNSWLIRFRRDRDSAERAFFVAAHTTQEACDFAWNRIQVYFGDHCIPVLVEFTVTLVVDSGEI